MTHIVRILNSLFIDPKKKGSREYFTICDSLELMKVGIGNGSEIYLIEKYDFSHFQLKNRLFLTTGMILQSKK